jgi:hypothetical protein
MWHKKIIASVRMWSTTPVSLVWALTFRQHSTVSTTTTTTTSSSWLMDPIVTHPAVAALQLDKRPRAKLKERHKHLFQQDRNGLTPNTTTSNSTNNSTTKNNTSWTTSLTLLNELGTIACETGVVPRKELFETYAAALYMQDRFPNVQRVADLAGGHGLLSWFLLVLDPTRTRSAVVVDRCMPDSAESIAQGMLQRFPELESQWTYVVADLSGVEAHPSTLLASVHACGSLSDYLIQLSIGSGAPLAVAPCCHTVQASKGYKPHVLSGMDAESVSALVHQNKKTNGGGASLADVVDGIRCQTLETAGFRVHEAKLPSLFTEKNRLILAHVDSTNVNGRVARMNSLSAASSQPGGTFFERKAIAIGKPKVPKVRIPLADDPLSIAACRAISGKDQAALRLMQTIPRHYSPSFEVSVFLSPKMSTDNNATGDSTPQEVETRLQTLASQCCGSHPLAAETIRVDCLLQRVGEVHLHPSTGRRVQTYRLEYRAPERTSIERSRIPKEVAKEIHQDFLRLIKASDLGLETR